MLSKSQQALDDAVALDEDARVDDLVREPVVVDVLDHGRVLRARLQPQRGDRQRLGLLEDAQRHLYECVCTAICEHRGGAVCVREPERVPWAA